MNFLLIIFAASLTLTWKILYVLSSDIETNSDLRIVEAAEKLMQSMIEESELLVRNALQDIPKSKEYEEHRENFQQFLSETEDYKSKSGDCRAKRLKYNQSTSSIMRPYLESGEEASAQQKVVARILNRHGMQELRETLKKSLRNVYSGEYGTPSKDIEKVYAEYVATHCYATEKNEL